MRGLIPTSIKAVGMHLISTGQAKIHQEKFMQSCITMTLLLILGFIFLSVFLYTQLIYPAILSPLSKIPSAHFTSSFSNGWILWQRYMGRENRAIHEAHTRLGPIIRLGATEISVNSIEALRTVYSNRLDKHEFYSRAFDNYGYIRETFDHSGIAENV